MLNLPNSGYKVFEVTLYNEQVRALAETRRRRVQKRKTAEAERENPLLSEVLLNTHSKTFREKLTGSSSLNLSRFSDEWSKPQIRDVIARDEAEAWSLIVQRFPPEDGFVVERIVSSRF